MRRLGTGRGFACAVGAGAIAACAGAAAGWPPLIYSAYLGGTGTTSSGVTAPPGTLWSELPTSSSSALGFLVETASGARLADDFTVTDAEGWAVIEVQVYAYQPGAKTTDQPITGASARIWRGAPGAPGSAIVCESSVTGATGDFCGLYRTDRRGLTTRPIFSVRIPMQVTLRAGQYWLDWTVSGKLGAGVWSPPCTTPGAPAANAMQNLGGAWAPAMEPSALLNGAPIPQGLPMVIRGAIAGASPTCYANCDGSAQAPVLSLYDFSCFLQHFAAGSPYANCDESTTTPILTVSDFTCYLQAFANGCSPP